MNDVTKDETMDPNELNFEERELFKAIPEGKDLLKIIESGIEINSIVDLKSTWPIKKYQDCFDEILEDKEVIVEVSKPFDDELDNVCNQ